MKNLFILMFVVSFFGVSSAFATEGESLTHADGSYCEEGGKTPASFSTVREEVEDSSGSTRD